MKAVKTVTSLTHSNGFGNVVSTGLFMAWEIVLCFLSVAKLFLTSSAMLEV